MITKKMEIENESTVRVIERETEIDIMANTLHKYLCH